MRSVLTSAARTLIGIGPTRAEVAAKALAILESAKRFGGDEPEHLPALTALALVTEARTSAPLAARAALLGDGAVATLNTLRAAATEELRSLLVRRPDLCIGAQSKAIVPLFLGLARADLTPAFRAMCDLVSPINRVARGPIEFLYRGASSERNAIERILRAEGRPVPPPNELLELSPAQIKELEVLAVKHAIPFRRATSDVANLMVYYDDPVSGTTKVMAVVIAGSQARPNMAASALSLLDVLGDSAGESIENKNQRIGRLIVENLIPELGVKIRDNSAIDRAKSELAHRLVGTYRAELVGKGIITNAFLDSFVERPTPGDRDVLLNAVRGYVKDRKELRIDWAKEMQLAGRELDLFRGGFGFTDDQLERIGAKVDNLTRSGGGVIAVSPRNPSRAFVGHLRLEDLRDAIVAELGDGQAEVVQGLVDIDSIEEILERGREIVFIPLEQHFDVSRDLRARIGNFLRAAATKEPLDAATMRMFGDDQICRKPMVGGPTPRKDSLAAAAVEYYAASAPRGGIRIEAPTSYALPGGQLAVSNTRVVIDKGIGEEAKSIDCNVANLGDWQCDIPYVVADGRVFVGTTPTLSDGEIARFTEPLSENIRFAEEKPSVRQSAVMTELDADAYRYLPKSYSVQDVVRFRGRDVSKLGLSENYGLDELESALTQRYARQLRLLKDDAPALDPRRPLADVLASARNADAREELRLYAASARSLHDPNNYCTIRFRETRNVQLDERMTAVGYTEVESFQLGSHGSSVGEDAGLMNFRASRWEATDGAVRQVDGIVFEELSVVLENMVANPGAYDQTTMNLVMTLATKLPSPDGTTSYWNFAFAIAPDAPRQ